MLHYGVRGHRRKISLSVFAFLMAGGATSPVFAQGTAAAPGAEAEDNTSDIVVTAQKREQLLQDVPIAISAVSADDLSNRGVTDLQNLSSSVASLSMSGSFGVGGNTSIGIRGVSGQPIPAGVGTTVAVYVDGEYQPSPFSSFFTLDDVERVEVLRGPQGTLYGRNSTAGAINIVTREPGDTFRGGIDVSYGNYNHVLAKGSVSGPLGSGFAAGLSGSYERRDGFFRNSVTGNIVDDTESYTIRGKLAYRSADDAFKMILAGDTSKQTGFSTVLKNIYAPFSPVAGVYVGIGDPKLVAYDAVSESRIAESRKSSGVSLAMHYDISPSIRLSSLTAYRSEHTQLTYDLDATIVPAILSDVENRDKAFQQELRGSYTGDALDLTVGVNYFHDKQNFGAFQGTPLVTVPRKSPLITSNLKAFAIFGQAEWHITEKLTATAGLRWNNENRDWSVDYRSSNLPTGAPFVGAFFTGKVKDKLFIPSGGLSYEITPRVMVYAKISRGYQAPGFNGFPGPTATVAPGFLAEKLIAYEAGLKSQFLDNRVTLNLASFHYDYTNLQVRNTIGTGQVEISNAGAATVDGLELTLSARIMAGLQLSGNLSWTDAKYKLFCEIASSGALSLGDAACMTVRGQAGWQRGGNRLINAPEWQGNIALDYTVDVGDAGELRFNVSYAGASNTYYNATNDPLIASGSTDRIDGRVGFRLHSGLEFYAYGRNLTDDRYVNMGLRGFPTFAAVHISDPRTYGVGFKYRF